MEMTKSQFRRRWAGLDGGETTNEDIFDCAKAWGLFFLAKIHNLNKVMDAVVKAAGVSPCQTCPVHSERGCLGCLKRDN
jgi:hypothetical protein